MFIQRLVKRGFRPRKISPVRTTRVSDDSRSKDLRLLRPGMRILRNRDDGYNGWGLWLASSDSAGIFFHPSIKHSVVYIRSTVFLKARTEDSSTILLLADERRCRHWVTRWTRDRDDAGVTWGKMDHPPFEMSHFYLRWKKNGKNGSFLNTLLYLCKVVSLTRSSVDKGMLEGKMVHGIFVQWVFCVSHERNGKNGPFSSPSPFHPHLYNLHETESAQSSVCRVWQDGPVSFQDKDSYHSQ